MTFIRTIPPNEATGDLKDLYDQDPAKGGPGSTVLAWSLRPEAHVATRALTQALRSHLDERRAQFVAVVAASSVRCSVCTLQHGSILLRSSFFTPAQLEALATDHRGAGLDPVDEAIATFVKLVALHADQVMQADIDELRTNGLDDAEIFDIVLWTMFWVFWSGVHNAIGYEPSPGWIERTRASLGGDLWSVLSVGRQHELNG